MAITRVMGTVVVTTHGLLDPDGSRALELALRDLIDNQGNLSVVVDLADLHMPDPACLGALAAGAAAAGRRGGELTFAEPCQAMAAGLEAIGLGGAVTGARPRPPAAIAGPAIVWSSRWPTAPGDRPRTRPGPAAAPTTPIDHHAPRLACGAPPAKSWR